MPFVLFQSGARAHSCLEQSELVKVIERNLCNGQDVGTCFWCVLLTTIADQRCDIPYILLQFI